MTADVVRATLQETNADDMRYVGEHKTRNGLRFETLNTQAGMRVYYRLRALIRRSDAKGCKVVCGETNNGTGRFFVRISGLEK